MPNKPKTVNQLRNGTKRPPTRRPDHDKTYGRRHRTYRSQLLQEAMSIAAQADLHPCYDCATEGEPFRLPDRPLHLHHMDKVADAPHRQYDESNALFLCEKHHNMRTARGE